jgi:hypothetical protein
MQLHRLLGESTFNLCLNLNSRYVSATQGHDQFIYEVKLPLCLTKHMKAYGGVDVKIRDLLTPALVADEWPA